MLHQCPFQANSMVSKHWNKNRMKIEFTFIWLGSWCSYSVLNGTMFLILLLLLSSPITAATLRCQSKQQTIIMTIKCNETEISSFSAFSPLIKCRQSHKGTEREGGWSTQPGFVKDWFLGFYLAAAVVVFASMQTIFHEFANTKIRQWLRCACDHTHTHARKSKYEFYKNVLLADLKTMCSSKRWNAIK